jgi:uncharacterized protein YqiB (DUF1249 family)
MFRLRGFQSQRRHLCQQSLRQQVAPKASYRVNLPLQMAECEANYWRLMRLISNVEQDDYQFMVSRGQHHWLHKLQVIERSRYTTTLVLSLESSQTSQWLKMPRLTVRIYADAQLAEVLAWEGHKRLRPRYVYPNTFMYQHDEKLQVNQFLGEWLGVCLAEGHSLDDVMATLTG